MRVAILATRAAFDFPAWLIPFEQEFERNGYQLIVRPISEISSDLIESLEAALLISHLTDILDAMDSIRIPLILCQHNLFNPRLLSLINEKQHLRERDVYCFWTDWAEVAPAREILKDFVGWKHFQDPHILLNGVARDHWESVASREVDVLFAGRITRKPMTRFQKMTASVFAKIFVNNHEYRIDEMADRFNKVWPLGGWSAQDFETEVIRKFEWRHELRSCRRLYAVDELKRLSNSVGVLVVGDDFGGAPENFSVSDFIPWEQLSREMGRAKIYVHSDAGLLRGVHEKIIEAITLGAVVISEPNQRLRELFVDGESIVFFDYSRGDLSGKVSALLEDAEQMEKIRCKAWEVARREFRPESRVEAWINVLTG